MAEPSAPANASAGGGAGGEGNGEQGFSLDEVAAQLQVTPAEVITAARGELMVEEDWKKHAPFFYDLFLGYTLLWPALSVAWLPDVPQEPCHLALGIQTDGTAQHEVIIAELNCHLEPLQVTDDNQIADPWRKWSSEGLGEEEAYGFGFGVYHERGAGPLRPVARLAHPTEVNRIAACPSRPHVLATKAADGTVLLFDYKVDRPAGVVKPDATLRPKGEPIDGFALDWSAGAQRALLASGGNDGRLCIWEVEGGLKGQDIHPFYEVEKAHDGAVCSLCFSHAEPSLLVSVSDDGSLRIWDVRAGMSPQSTAKASSDEVLTVDWSRLQAHSLATAGKDGNVCVWDLRTLTVPTHTLRGHEADVVVVHWSPHQEGLLGSASKDSRLILWDLSGEAAPGGGPDEGEGETESPELFFEHDVHGEPISDFAWCTADEGLISSVSEDNTLHIWSALPEQRTARVLAEGKAAEAPPSGKRPRLEGPPGEV